MHSDDQCDYQICDYQVSNFIFSCLFIHVECKNKNAVGWAKCNANHIKPMLHAIWGILQAAQQQNFLPFVLCLNGCHMWYCDTYTSHHLLFFITLWANQKTPCICWNALYQQLADNKSIQKYQLTWRVWLKFVLQLSPMCFNYLTAVSSRGYFCLLQNQI